MSQTCLDQIIVDRDQFPYTVKNINMGISDHNGVFLNIHLNKVLESKSHKTVKYRRTFNEENIKYFKYMLEKEDWEDVINKTDTDTKYIEFLNTISHYFNMAFPMKKISVSNQQKNSKLWITRGIINSCRRKRQLHELSKSVCPTGVLTHHLLPLYPFII